jgi:1-acyl-sn-glycerol-3-phosphate acyltransferase
MGEDWRYEPAADLKVPWPKRAASELREAGLLGGLGHWFCWQVIGAYLRMLHPITVIGREHLPAETPFVLVANHASHLDVIVLQSLFPERLSGRIFALAAGDYFFDSAAKSLAAAQLVNALPVWRGKGTRHALAHLRERLVRGNCGFIVFPEGTRTRDGRMQSFKPGIGMLVAGTEIPVIPCALSGTFEAWPPEARWPRPGSIQVTIHKPRTFADHQNGREDWGRIAGELEALVAGS